MLSPLYGNLGPLGRALVAPVIPWWLAGGISATSVSGVWQPKGAASLAASYLRLAGSEGYANIDPAVVGVGVAPTFNAATGWSFDGTQWLDTGIIPNGYLPASCSAMVRYSNIPTNAYHYVFSAGTRFEIFGGYGGGHHRYQYGNVALSMVPEQLSGVIGMSGPQGYYNGNADGTALGVWNATQSNHLFIGYGAYGYKLIGKVQAFVAYNVTLTAPQTLAVATAMAAL
jgi:hypothetical protein